jgi:hypothetical protein
MAAAISLVMYCQNAGVNAGAPHQGIPNLSFQLPPKSDKVDDDNKGVFASETQRSGSLTLNNVPADIMSQFLTSPRVRVTVEILPE